ncbi:hypothetical protein HZB05_02075 [Candidatus Wolfebacteria bacterium]|nr:hypothetical protein [Candidatus Wolfebacteria bacterium]
MASELSKNYKHYILLATIAILVGLIYASHHFLIPRFISHGEIYYPISPLVESDQAVGYAPRVQAAYLGQRSVGDISLAEYKDGPAFLPPASPLIMAWLSKAVGSVKGGLVASDFIFPVFIFLLTFCLLNEILEKKFPAIAGAVFFVFAPRIGLLMPPISLLHLKELLFELFPFLNTPSPLFFSRFDYPKITFVFYLSAFLFTYRAIKYEKWRDVIFAGISGGALFYTYLYDWVYFFSGIGMVGFLFIWQKKYKKVKILTEISAVALICSAYYWFNFFILTSLPQYQDIVSRAGVEAGRFFRFLAWKSYLRGLIIVLLLWFVLKRNNRVLWTYLSGFLLSIIVVLNLQLITGFSPQPDHWHREQILATFLSLAVLTSWFFNKYKTRLFVSGLRVALLIGFGVLVAGEVYAQYNFSRISADKYIIDRASFASYNWLDANTLQNSVIASMSFETNQAFLLHTRNKIFLPNGINTIAPNEEIWNRFMMGNLLFGISEDDFARSIGPNGNAIEYLFHNYYRTGRSFNSYINGSAGRALSEDEFTVRTNKYHELRVASSTPPFAFKLDYIYVDNRSDNYRPKEEFLEEKVYDSGGIQIYKFKR